ncbi:hypothetical protein A9975_13915 [Cupriavidus sp. UME77]|nr:hypothetical protein [Cupriavidus sp. UME77]
MRRRQILNLEWRDIDVEQRTIHLRSETSKTRQSYDIPVPQSLLSELGMYRKIYCKRLGETKLMRVTKNPKLVQLQPGHTSLNTTIK